MSGIHVDHIDYDEGDSSVPKRELIAVDEDGRSVSIRFPADWDLGDALPDGCVIAVEAPSE